MSNYKYSTLAVHAGQYPDPLTGAVNVPVYLSSTFELTGIGTDQRLGLLARWQPHARPAGRSAGRA